MSRFRNGMERTVWCAAFATTNLAKGAPADESAADAAMRAWACVLRLRKARLEALVDNEEAIYMLREAQRDE